MRALEIEKVLRILSRCTLGTAYEGFVPNIMARHLPNLALLAAFSSRRGPRGG
jgi:hypothetical protein